jgi:hypothetical protein
MNIEDIFPGMTDSPHLKEGSSGNLGSPEETPEEKKKRQVAERRRYFILKNKRGKNNSGSK